MNTTQQKAIYTYIGQRIRQRRKLLQLNQKQLAEFMGFSYQQVQKYETGASQISAGKLLLFGKILNVPPSYFYEGIKLDAFIGKRIESDIIQRTRTEPLRILLIEDNPADVIIFRKALNACSEQAHVHTIHDAEEAMDFLQNQDMKFGQKQPDIIVLDLCMFKRGGMDLLKSVKKNPKTQGFPVVVLTSSVSVKDMVEAYKYGAASFIQKSVDPLEYKESMEVVVKYWSKIVALPCAS